MKTGNKRRSGIQDPQEMKEKIKTATIFPELEEKREEDLGFTNNNINFNNNLNNNINNNNNNNINNNQEDNFEALYKQDFGIELKKGNNKEYIISLFSHPFYAELFFAWCKDCSENITVENAKFFRDELLLRKNKDSFNFNFKSMRVSKNFLIAFVGNLNSSRIEKLNLADNLINDVCMHNIKSIVSAKKLVHLNLASNMISTEGLKIFQNDVMFSDSLKYLNVSEFGFYLNLVRHS